MRHAHGLILTCDGTVERALTPFLLYFGLADGRAARGETCMHRACRIGRSADPQRVRKLAFEVIGSPSPIHIPAFNSAPSRLVSLCRAPGPVSKSLQQKNPACLGQPCSSKEARQAFLRRFDIFGGISLSS